MTSAEEQAVLRATRTVYRLRHAYPSAPVADLERAMAWLDEATLALLDAEAAARVKANPLSKLGG